jgi:transcriptional regulator with XRE-family HTH domain
MKCIECGKETTKHRATKDEPYRFLGSGLKNIYLAGIDVEECKSCDVEYPTIPRLPDLHRAIAETLAMHRPSPLSGDELRFVRKAAGFSAKRFASLLLIEPESLSRAENGGGLGPQTDKLARAITLAALNAETVKDVLLELADKMERAKKLATSPVFRCDRDGWKIAA